jgi:hypothetical protein
VLLLLLPGSSSPSLGRQNSVYCSWSIRSILGMMVEMPEGEIGIRVSKSGASKNSSVVGDLPPLDLENFKVSILLCCFEQSTPR